MIFLVIEEDFFLWGDPRAVGEGKEKRGEIPGV